MNKSPDDDLLQECIADMQSAPHLSVKEERHLAVYSELQLLRDAIAGVKSLRYAARGDCPYLSEDANYATHYADGYNEALSDIRFYL